MRYRCTAKTYVSYYMTEKQFVICIITVTAVTLETGTSNRSDGLGMTGVWENTMRR